MTTNPKTLRNKRLPDIAGKVRLREFRKRMPGFSRDQISYWAQWLKPDKIGNTAYYNESDVEVMQHMATLVYTLQLPPGEAVRLARKFQASEIIHRDKKWIEHKGVQIGIPLEFEVH